MAVYGLLIDYEYCSGCHTCEIACQQEHRYDPKTLGIEVMTLGPTPLGNNKWEYDNIPVPTAFCDHCKDRIEKGKIPTCVKHCQAGCMTFGEITDLAKKVDREKMVIFALK